MSTARGGESSAFEPGLEHLIGALKAAGKQFEYKIYTNAPGGHAFNRIDTKLAKESRADVYRFLAKHLNPPDPVK